MYAAPKISTAAGRGRQETHAPNVSNGRSRVHEDITKMRITSALRLLKQDRPHQFEAITFPQPLSAVERRGIVWLGNVQQSLKLTLEPLRPGKDERGKKVTPSSAPCTASNDKQNLVSCAGILAQQYDSTNESVTFIAASYVKFVESAGARAVPIR